jgi:uncharacterized membrane protein YqiK
MKILFVFLAPLIMSVLSVSAGFLLKLIFHLDLFQSTIIFIGSVIALTVIFTMTLIMSYFHDQEILIELDRSRKPSLKKVRTGRF